MGYNIEISFDIYKNSSVTNLKYELIEIAERNYCNYHHENFIIDYEFDHGLTLCEKRNHCIISFSFDNSKILNFIKFLNKIKNLRPFHIETIYDNDNSRIIYASKYYQGQMNKYLVEKYKIQRNNPLNNFNSTDNLILLNINK